MMMTVTSEGNTIMITQPPYIDRPSDKRPIYNANGRDVEGNKYIVVWDVVDGEMCNWDRPSGILRLN